MAYEISMKYKVYKDELWPVETLSDAICDGPLSYKRLKVLCGDGPYMNTVKACYF